MTNNEDRFLTDKEIDEISAERQYVYELKHHSSKGDYYKCTTTDGLKTMCIGEDRWNEWVKRAKGRGNTINPL